MMNENEKLALQERIIEALKTVYDPEIPVNIYAHGHTANIFRDA